MRHVISRLRVCRRRRLRAAYRERDVRQYAYGHRRGAPVPVALVNVIGHLIVSNTPTVFPFVHEASCGPRLYPGIDIMARSKTARRLERPCGRRTTLIHRCRACRAMTCQNATERGIRWDA